VVPVREASVGYDRALAARPRKADRRKVRERGQFGRIGLLLKGNMAVAVIGSDLRVRVGPASHDAAMSDRHAKPFAIIFRPSRPPA
jgi:hypothetical protein